MKIFIKQVESHEYESLQEFLKVVGIGVQVPTKKEQKFFLHEEDNTEHLDATHASLTPMDTPFRIVQSLDQQEYAITEETIKIQPISHTLSNEPKKVSTQAFDQETLQKAQEKIYSDQI